MARCFWTSLQREARATGPCISGAIQGVAGEERGGQNVETVSTYIHLNPACAKLPADLLKKGMKALWVEEDAEIAGKKGSLTKSALAWHVHRRAMAGHKWISARLRMRCPSNLTAHINRIRQASESEALRMPRKLEHV